MASAGSTVSVNLNFTASTKQAKAEIDKLQESLKKIAVSENKSGSLGISKEIKEADAAAVSLQAHLRNAIDPKSGKLDLSKLNQSFKEANVSLETYRKALAKASPEGQQAFNNLAKSILQADVPLKQTNKLIKEFGVTLKNTVKWQLSSGIVHGLVGSMQSAYGYAQDLNKSLSNIRIVTGQSADEMANFAKQANESAKALNVSTTAYTDAALIFYQQGLGDKEVKERTDAVIKMSNITGDSVEDVSSYMTAIWNNFDDGSKSLEHYADVITALGAATASSSAEIANGLERFASIGETVGLSYDYATSALATVVATTRQSEEIVGTAFKTIFARMQGLQQGETLEDGTNLNKYSQALENVGVQVLDENDKLRDMDLILDDLGAKWETLSRDQQNALAQTVAGTRQYTQLLALMNNWDFFKENVETARNAEGTLQEQADIYAESWEAANKRLRASFQGLWDTVINDEFFIEIINGTAKIIELVDKLIDSVGGLPGILGTIGAAVTNLYSKDISKGINNLINGFRNNPQKIAEQMRDQAMTQLTAGENLPEMMKNENINELQKAYYSNYDKLSEFERLQVQYAIEAYQLKQQALDEGREILHKKQEELQVENQVVDKAQEEYDFLVKKEQILQEETNIRAANKQGARSLTNASAQKARDLLVPGLAEENRDIVRTQVKQYRELYNTLSDLGNIKGLDQRSNLITFIKSLNQNKIGKIGNLLGDKFKEDLLAIQENGEKAATALNRLQEAINKKNPNTQALENIVNTFKKLKEGYAEGTVSAEQFKNALIDMADNIEILESQKKAEAEAKKQAVEVTTQAAEAEERLAQAIDSAEKSSKRLTEQEGKLKQEQNDLNNSARQGAANVEKIANGGNKKNYGEAFTGLFQSMSAMVSMGTTLTNIVDTVSAVFQKGSIKGEDLVRVLSSLASGGISAIFAFQGLTTTLTNFGMKAAEAATAAGTVTIAITGIILAFSIGLKVIDHFTTSIEEANEAIQKFEDAKSEIESLKNQIEETSNKIDELKSKGPLTFLEQAELDKLEKSNELLETNLQIQERKAAIEAAQAVTTTQDALKEKNYGSITPEKIISYKEAQKSAGGYVGNISYFGEVSEAIAYYQTLDELIEETTKKLENDPGNKKLEEQLEKYKDAQGNALEMPLEAAENVQKMLESLYNDKMFNKDHFDLIDGESQIKELEQIQKILLDITNPGKYKTLSFDKILDLPGFEKQLNKLKEKEGEITNDDVANAFKYGFANFQQILSEYDISLDEFVNEWNARLNEIPETLSSLDLKGAIGQFNELKGLLSATEDYIVAPEEFNKLKDQLPGIEESFHMLADGNYMFAGSIQELQQAMDALNTNNFGKVLADATQKLKDFSFNNEYNSAEHFNLAATSADNDKGHFEDQITALREFSDISEDVLNKYQENWEQGGQVATETALKVSQKLRDLNVTQEDLINRQHEYIDEWRQAKEAFEDAIDPLDEDIDPKAFQEMKQAIEDLAETSDDFSKDLLKNSFVAEDVAEAFLRFDDACKDVRDNYEEWLDLLSSDVLQDQITAAEGLRDAYGDLLDIDGDLLPTDFLTDVDNLNLMRDAINGNIEAYDELAARAAVGILISCGIDKIEAEADIEHIKSLIGNIDDIEIGAHIWKADAETALNELISNAGLTASQVNALLGSMGVDATIVPQETEQEISSTYTNLIPTEGTSHTFTYDMPSGNSEDGEITTTPTKFTIPSVKWKTQEGKSKEVKKAAAAGVQFEAGDGTSTGGKVKIAPNSLRKIASGGDKFQNSSNGAGAAGQAARAPKGGGGKGRGGGGKGKEPKKPKEIEIKKEELIKEKVGRYKELEAAIDRVTRAMGRLNKLQDHLHGKELINSLKTENKMLEKQKKNYEALNAELTKHNENINKKLKKQGYETIKEDDGYISNYREVFNSIKKRYNEAVKAFNKSQKEYKKQAEKFDDGDKQEEFIKDNEKRLKKEEKQIAKEKKKYEKAKKRLEKYEDNLQKIKDNADKIEDMLYQQIENNLKRFETKVKISLDLKQATRDVNNFINSTSKNFQAKFKSAAETMADLNTKLANAHTYTDPGGTIETRLNQIKKVQDIIGDDSYDYHSKNSLFASRSEAIEKLKEYQDELIKEGTDLYQLWQDAYDEYMSYMDSVGEEWDSRLDDLAEIMDQFDHLSKLNELLYGENSAQGLANQQKINQKELKTSLETQKALRKEIDTWEKEYNEMIKNGADKNSQDMIKIKDRIKDANKKLTTEIESYLETAIKKYETSIKQIMTAADKNINKVGKNSYSTELLKERYDLEQAAKEGYYDEVERVYQIERIENLYNQAIKGTDSIKNQQYLNKLKEKALASLKAEVNLSEYDVTLEEKRLEAYKAYVELKDSQDQKNAMKLTRNDAGDWTYQYVADDTDVLAKTQDWLDKQYEAYEYVVQSQAEAIERLMTLQLEAEERLSEIAEEMRTADDTRRAELQEQYEYLLGYYWGDDGIITRTARETNDMERDLSEETVKTLQAEYDANSSSYEIMTDKQKDLITELKRQGIDDYRELTHQIATDPNSFYKSMGAAIKDVVDENTGDWERQIKAIIKKWVTNPDSVMKQMQIAYGKIQKAVHDYDSDIEKSEQASGEAWSNIELGIDYANKQLKDLNLNLDELIGKTGQLSEQKAVVDELAAAWNSVKDAIYATLQANLELLGLQAEDNSEDEKEGKGGGKKGKGKTFSVSVEDGDGDAWIGDVQAKNKKKAEQKAIKEHQKAFGNKTHSAGGGYTVKSNKTNNNNNNKGNNQKKKKGQGKVKLATGGYTGDWSGNEGKEAILHKKELVLNQEDTKNILAATAVVRSISNLLSGIGLSTAALHSTLNPNPTVNNTNTDSKIFNITAEFPNANSVTAIQEAILNLPNLASQYINANK